MKKRIVKIGSIVLILVVLVAGYKIFSKGAAPALVKLDTEKVVKGEINAIVTATGTIEATKQVEVGTQVSGVVRKIYVDYNTHVKAGQLIAQLDKTNLQESLENAEAQYNIARTEEAYLGKIYQRQKGLYESQLISEADYDEALYKWNTAKSTVLQRKADLSKAKTNLSYADIYSPIDGVVLSMDVEEGQTVAASFSTPTLFTIAQDLTSMQVEADVDEADIGNVKEGQRVTFTVDAYPEEAFSGVVTQVRLNATVTSSVVTYAVIVKATNKDLKLKPGLTATISIYTSELKDVLVIKEKALAFQPDPDLLKRYYGQHQLSPDLKAKKDTGFLDDPTNKWVWVLDKNGMLKHRLVQLGPGDGIYIQVTSGLSTGELVALDLAEEEVNPGLGASGGSPFMPKPPGKK